MITVLDLVKLLTVPDSETAGMEVRIGDVSEGDDLHCSVGRIVKRGGCIVLVPGDDDIWKDEMLSSNILMEHLWPPKEEDIED